MMTIRPYKSADATTLAAYYNDLNSADMVTARRLNGRLSAWSLTWVICDEGMPVGYACVAPLPGLPGQYDLDMLIARAWQRKRLGSQLVDFLKQELTGSEVAALSWGVTEAQVGIANFLAHNGFVMNHEESILARPHLDDLPPPPSQPNLTIYTYSRRKAIRLFCRLYEASFFKHPWFQPYTPDEVAADLASARDILFLSGQKRPFGFAWLHIDKNGEGKVEPFGILPAGQGEGNGRFLLISALHELKHRGAHRAIIGTWADNKIALHLYKDLGFHLQQTITYYACRL